LQELGVSISCYRNTTITGLRGPTIDEKMGSGSARSNLLGEMGSLFEKSKDTETGGARFWQNCGGAREQTKGVEDPASRGLGLWGVKRSQPNEGRKRRNFE